MRVVGTRFIALFVFRASARAEEKLLAELPGMLDRIDGWIEAGVLNGDELNAADFMIAPSLHCSLPARPSSGDRAAACDPARGSLAARALFGAAAFSPLDGRRWRAARRRRALPGCRRGRDRD